MTPQEMIEGVRSAARVEVHNGGLELTEWEQTFVDNVERQLGRERDLSEKQLAILRELWDRT